MGVAGMFLAQPLLFRSLCYIDGRWVHSNQGSSIAVHNPADQSLLGHVPMLEQSQIEQAVQAAHKAQCLWRYTALNERGGYLHRWAALTVEPRAALAKILSRKSVVEGKRGYGTVCPGCVGDLKQKLQ